MQRCITQPKQLKAPFCFMKNKGRPAPKGCGRPTLQDFASFSSGRFSSNNNSLATTSVT